MNTGEYDLSVEDITVNGGTIWSLSDAFSPFTVPPGETVDVKVKFTPEEEGKAPMGMVTVTTNDIRPQTGTQMINLIGNGKLRNVDLAPGSIDVGDTFAGIPARLSVTRPGDILTVLNMDQETFNIRDIKISGEDEEVFHLINLDGSEFSAVDIEPGSSQTFDIVFSPTVPGEFTSSVVLYLDDDQDVQKSIPITGRAVYVSAHGAGGCSVGGGGSGGLVVICVAGLFVVRRRRR
jgi:MYXO-CTERM domain-containing protein